MSIHLYPSSTHAHLAYVSWLYQDFLLSLYTELMMFSIPKPFQHFYIFIKTIYYVCGEHLVPKMFYCHLDLTHNVCKT